MSAIWKIPSVWQGLGLADRTALYPALYLRWAGTPTTIARAPALDQWTAADLRVLISDGPLTQDERELMTLAASRRLPLVLAAQSGLSEADRALAAGLGAPIVAWTDPGPLATPPPGQAAQVAGCAARLAEDRLLTRTDAARRPARLPGAALLAATVENVQVLEAIWPALERRMSLGPVEIIVAADDAAVLREVSALPHVKAVPAADPSLLAAIADAEAFLCVHPTTAADCPRPGQWVRSALFAGAPVIAASHPSIDGLAHLCVLDDWERGLELYRRFPDERTRIVAAAQAELAARLRPDRVAGEWKALAAKTSDRARRPRPAAPQPPLLLTLIDIHQDLDVLLPVLLALQARGEVRQRIALTHWLVTESPRVANTLAAHGFEFEVHPREAVRKGDVPSLAGVDAVLSGADTSTRAHKAGHTLIGRARAKGLKTFTLQHGLENIGLTYKDHLHGEDIRFAAETIFTWGRAENLAPWAAAETRAAVVPVGSPKAAPPPAAAARLNQGRWRRIVGVFENLHWHRFSELYLEQALFDLDHAAAEHLDTLFLVKPHHAGRWLSRNRGRLRERPNLAVIDPTDSAWEPHTAPALIAAVDAVLTTPSTVALDAARAGRPAAVLGYDLDLPLYAPLPIIRGGSDIERFLEEDSGEGLLRNEAFLRRTALPGRADHRIAARIAASVQAPAAAKVGFRLKFRS